MVSVNHRLAYESSDGYDLCEASALLDNNDEVDVEDHEEKPRYPRSIFFIITNEFCERFSYYGMRTILALYLKTILGYSDDDATVIYHVFAMLCYFFPIFGAMLADSLLGKFRTIFYVSIVYAIGNVVISIASANDAIDGMPAREISIVGLLLIAIGTGGIKPCVSAFGGDQFKLPQQERQLQQFFSLFYFAINSGSLISTFLTPVLREDVTCLDQDSCYPLAFGIPAVLMIISIIIFVAGKRLYIIKNPEGNVVLKVCKCIGHAIARRQKLKHENREHWLDYADDTYDREMIDGVKATLRVLFLYIPLPVFWALFDQQGSRWTFQATRMTGELGNWALKPDQLQVVNPLLILIFIPLFETVIYPLLSKCNLLKKPLQRLFVGGVLAAVAFVISAIVELQLEDTYAVLPQSGEAQLRIFNGFNCNAKVLSNIPNGNDIDINSLSFWQAQTLSVHGDQSYTISSIELQNCPSGPPEGWKVSTEISVTEAQATSYFITYNDDRTEIELKPLSSPPDYDAIDKSKGGDPLLRVIYTFKDMPANKTLRFREVDGDDSKDIELGKTEYKTTPTEIEPTTFHVSIDDDSLGDVKLQLGGVYTLLIQENNEVDYSLLTITNPNSIHMLWLIPQYIVITMGEVMFSITGLEFSFTQAPVSMKSVLQACWLLTVAFGNLIVVIIAEAKFFDSQANEFFLFAGLMVVDMIIFALMAMRYKYVEVPDAGANEDDQSTDLALKETQYSEKSGLDNATFKGDNDY